MSTTPTPPSSTADRILALLDSILSSAGTLIPDSQLADFFVKIAQKGVAAYESHSGQPIDPTLIKPIEKVS